MRIDTTKIAGYSEMSPEDKLKALEEFEFSDRSDELEKMTADYKKAKESFDKTASELAALKKASRTGQSEIERQKEEYEEKLSELTSQLDEMKKENSTTKLVASYTKQGYKPELAQKKAKAMIEGDNDTVLACEEEFRTFIEKSIRAEAIKGTSKPDDNGGSKSYKTKDEIMKIKDASERQKAISEHLDLFN